MHLSVQCINVIYLLTYLPIYVLFKTGLLYSKGWGGGGQIILVSFFILNNYSVAPKQILPNVIIYYVFV